MPAAVVHSATVAHSAILTGLTDTSAIGFIASALVLAAFGMKDMVNLRIVAICSNIAFSSLMRWCSTCCPYWCCTSCYCH